MARWRMKMINTAMIQHIKSFEADTIVLALQGHARKWKSSDWNTLLIVSMS